METDVDVPFKGLGTGGTNGAIVGAILNTLAITLNIKGGRPDYGLGGMG
jgi:hypothetical protein